MSHLKWDAAKTTVENAKEQAPELARQFFLAGAEAADSRTAVAAIHHFRLMTKRFRYTLELFRDYYGPALEKRIELLQRLQQDLGAISDCSATQKLLSHRKDVSDVERARLDKKLDGLAKVRVAKFRRDWHKDFAPHERDWIKYLAGASKRATGP